MNAVYKARKWERRGTNEGEKSAMQNEFKMSKTSVHAAMLFSVNWLDSHCE